MHYVHSTNIIYHSQSLLFKLFNLFKILIFFVEGEKESIVIGNYLR